MSGHEQRNVAANATLSRMARYVIALEPTLPLWSSTEEYPDDETAKREGDLVARDLVRVHRPILRSERITVKDESGQLIHEVYLATAMMKL